MDSICTDINADLGESPESLANGTDAAIMQQISSANIACGAHAGDEDTMRRTVELARYFGVAVGAHPGYPDRRNFGRLEMVMAPAELQGTVRNQIASLARVCSTVGVKLVHVKPHGALYHSANRDRGTALAIGEAVREIDQELVLVGQAGSSVLSIWRDMGLECVGEAFADRLYEPDGTLRRRTIPGALIEAPEQAAEQALRIATARSVVASDGTALHIEAGTLCIHSDTPGAAVTARVLRCRLEQAGILIRALR